MCSGESPSVGNDVIVSACRRVRLNRLDIEGEVGRAARAVLRRPAVIITPKFIDRVIMKQSQTARTVGSVEDIARQCGPDLDQIDEHRNEDRRN